jgi:hypothetical protein
MKVPNKLIKLAYALILLGVFHKGHAYANFISHGYTSCLTCHYNALGDGPLNDYGRAVSATAIASRSFYSDKTDEQSLGDRSNFFFGKWRDQKWFRPSINVRGLRYDRNVFESARISKNILMQADGNIVIRPLEKDKLFFSGSFGYAPTPQTNKSSGAQKNVISREHYLQWAPVRSHRIYFGLMNKAYGVRVPDHIAFSRTVTGLAQNDQSHGVIYHYTNNNFELAANYFMGNLYQDKLLRQVGGSFTTEYEFANRLRIGASVLKSKNQYLDYFMNTFFIKMGIGEGSSIISELGQVTKTPINSDVAKTIGVYNFTQHSIKLSRGTNFLTTFEYYKSNIQTSMVNNNYRLGFGIQYFPMQRIELRFDLVDSRIIAPSTIVTDTMDLMTQVHLWF